MIVERITGVQLTWKQASKIDDVRTTVAAAMRLDVARHVQRPPYRARPRSIVGSLFADVRRVVDVFSSSIRSSRSRM
jgi:hypothetical protein